MAVVSRIATLKFDNGLGSTRQWQATAAVQDTAEGQSVSVTVEQTSGGASPPGVADTLTLNFYNENGGLIRAVGLTPGNATSVATFYFTDTGNTGGSARHGTVEIAIRATKTTGGGLATYDYETDGSPATPPSTFNATQVDRGWIRGTTTLLEAVSNVSAGGAKSEPAEYDESLYFRATLGSLSYVARALTVASSAGSLSGNTNNTASATRDATFTNVVDERFAAASTVIGWTVTAPNTALTGQPYTTFSSTTDDTITVDPRATRTYHFQINDNTFGLSKADTTRRMLSTQSGFLWSIIKGARGTGINGLTVSQTLTPTNPGTAVTGSGTTSTQDGQAGVSPRLDWTASKPDGAWTMVADITAPSDIDGDTYLLQSGETYTMVARDPYIEAAASGGDTTRPGTHFVRGQPFTFGGALINKLTGQLVEADSGDANRKAIVGRFNPSLNGGLGGAEYLDASFAWQPWNSTLAAYQHQLTEYVASSRLYLAQASAVATALWGGDYPIFVLPILYRSGWPYGLPVESGVFGLMNRHDVQDFDPTGLFK